MDEVSLKEQSLMVKFKKSCNSAIFPKKADAGSAGYDLYAAENKKIRAGKRELVSTGIIWEPNVNELELQIRSRSGLAFKNGIIVLNEPGTVDASYRGVIGVLLYNTSDEDYEVKKGDRIAQGIINLLPKVTIWNVEDNKMEFSMTERGQGGFGHSGK